MSRLPAALEPEYTKFVQANELRKRDKITQEEYTECYNKFVEAGKKLGVTISMYDAANERRPKYPVGDNSNRSDFTYGPENKKWQTMQRVIKPAMIAIINKMHKWVLTKWDEDAYVYDDCRMQVLDKTAHDFIDRHFDHQNRKLDFMHKGADICLFFMKEDIFYSSRIFHMLNSMPFFILTQEEQENIAIFSRGIEEVNAFTNEHVVYNDSHIQEAVKC